MDRSIAHRATRLLILSLVITGCGGAVVPADEPAGADSSTPTEAPPAVVAVNCPDEMSDFIAALQELDSRLNVGMNFQEYSERVGDARVAYDKIDVEDLDDSCIEHVGVPAEDAMNAYIDANSTWNECISDPDCTNDSITAELQSKWAEATELIEEAENGLDQ